MYFATLGTPTVSSPKALQKTYTASRLSGGAPRQLLVKIVNNAIKENTKNNAKYSPLNEENKNHELNVFVVMATSCTWLNMFVHDCA